MPPEAVIILRLCNFHVFCADVDFMALMQASNIAVPLYFFCVCETGRVEKFTMKIKVKKVRKTFCW